jgi:hypothetical protein
MVNPTPRASPIQIKRQFSFPSLYPWCRSTSDWRRPPKTTPPPTNTAVHEVEPAAVGATLARWAIVPLFLPGWMPSPPWCSCRCPATPHRSDPPLADAPRPVHHSWWLRFSRWNRLHRLFWPWARPHQRGMGRMRPTYCSCLFEFFYLLKILENLFRLPKIV